MKEKIKALYIRHYENLSQFNAISNLLVNIGELVIINILFWSWSWLACIILDILLIVAMATPTKNTPALTNYLEAKK